MILTDADELRQALAIAVQERDEARAEVERLRGVQPEVPPRPPNGLDLPRYGLRWNGPTEPVPVPTEGGYWTPWHLAEAALRAAAECQREACAAEASGVACYGHGMDADEVWMRETCVDAVLATPLVTESDK